MLVLASLIYALAPAVVHETAAQANPFYYNGLARIVQIVLLVVFLRYGKARYFDAFFLGKEISTHRLERKHVADIGSSRLGRQCRRCGRQGSINTRTGNASRYIVAAQPPKLRLDDHLAFFHTSRCRYCSHPTQVSIRSFRQRSQFWNLLRVPLVWACVGTFDYALFAWSTQHAETAVAAAAFELWPLLLVSFMALHERRNDLYRGDHSDDAPQSKLISGEHVGLMAVAAAGLVFVLESQYDDGVSLILAQRSFGDATGALLAVGGAALAALTVCGSLVHGKLLYSKLMEDTRDGMPSDAVEKSDNSHQRLVLWLTMLGHLIAKSCSVPLLFVAGVFDFSGSSGMNPRGAVGAAALGGIIGVGGILLRKGNVDSSTPATNSLMLLSPLAALCFLGVVGIELPRMELFAVGAALIVASTLRMQTTAGKQRGDRRPHRSSTIRR